MKREVYTIPVPVWAMDYIFNAGLDCITADEIKLVDEFMEDIEFISPPAGEAYILRIPFWGLMQNFYDCEVIYKQTMENNNANN